LAPSYDCEAADVMATLILGEIDDEGAEQGPGSVCQQIREQEM
jgi:hypothetical protein